MKFVIGALAASSIAIATAAQAQKLDQKPDNYDPSEVVCESIKVVGSRLAVKRICATRSEWAAQRKYDRMEVERAQTQVRVKNCAQSSKYGC